MEYSMCRLKRLYLLLVLAVLWAAYPLYATSDQKGQSAPVPKGVSDAKSDQSRLSLEQCIDIALKNNPEVSRKKWNTETAWTERDIAQGRLWPELSAVGGYTHYRDDRLITPRRPGGQEVLGFTDELFSGDIVLSMPLYTGARLNNAVKAAELMAQSAKYQYLHSRRVLVFNVSNVFYSMLGQQQVIASLIFSQKALEEHHKRVSDLLDAQKAAKVDLLRTEVRLADIVQQLLRERNVFNIQRLLLASLLGLDRQDRHLNIQGELALTDVSARLDQGLSLAFKHRQDYQSLSSRADAQQKNLDMAKAGRLPQVALQASYGHRWAGDSAQDNEVGQVGVFAAIPLFEGGRIAARISRERTRLIAQKEALRELKLQIQLEVETAISNIESIRARIDVTQKASEQAKESLRIEREKYDLGKGAIVDVLDAQSALLDSQTNYHRALADYNTALAQFRLAVGEKS
jgi:outer membrane protein